jgi:uncharacterized protein YqjF (DUF2071 family)
MHQRWHDLLFAHWPLPADALAGHLPAGLQPDLFDGRVWIGVVPFRMSGVRLAGLPPLPGTGAFPELNVRSYVRHGEQPGVWFFSLDAASRLAVEAARRWFGLPYFRAHMSCTPQGDGVRYASRRADPRGAPAELRAEYGPTGAVCPAPPGTLEDFLTRRLTLFALDRRRRLLRGDIRHVPWSLQPASATLAVNTMGAAAGFRLHGPPPSLLFARRLDVQILAPRVVG